MRVNKSLLSELFRGFHIQRWNDRVRPMELIEMDKHAHKMIIAYCLGRYEEGAGRSVNWSEIIKGGIYELLRRIVISDVKSPIYSEIKKNREVFIQLNKYVYKQLEPKIEDEPFKKELYHFLLEDIYPTTFESRILEAAHIFSSYWEFQIIYNANPNSYQNVRIETELLNRINLYSDLIGIEKLTSRHTITNFIDLCGQLRFQLRWAQTPRVPKTSVLGHSQLVACISYLFARDNDACAKRLYNDFFGGLFHDLPEAVTRDILLPVKEGNPEFEKLIQDIELELSDKEILPYVEPEWRDELKYFTRDEFTNKIREKDGSITKDITIEQINADYNKDEFSPYDGDIIKAADKLAAFLEAWHSCNSGIQSDELINSLNKIKAEFMDKTIGKIPIKTLYSTY